VHLTARPEPRFPAPAKTLERVVAAAFNQRRKMLRASLRGLDSGIESRLERLGIAPTARAEEIGLQQFCLLASDLG
jgi:16S rRNA (adenine1518-N6/adenine1519-N6)-dimethyltransferase